MRLFLKNMALTGAMALVVYAVVMAVIALTGKVTAPNVKFKASSDGFMLTRFQEAAQAKPVDVLVIGSSHAYRGFDPRLFRAHGLEIFNLGSSAQTPIQSEYLLNQYLDVFKPKTVILEVMPNTFTSDGTESAIDLFSFHPADAGMFALALKVKTPTAINSYAYSFFRHLKRDFRNWHENKKSDSDQYIDGGYVEKFRFDSLPPVQEASVPQKLTFIWKQKRAFFSMLETLQSRNIRVELIQAPVTAHWFSGIANNNEIDQFFGEVSQQFKNVRYHNYAQLLARNETGYFYDYHHMNQKGVDLFNSKLLNDLFPRAEKMILVEGNSTASKPH
jgi:poly-D-alanine transfer protein DltD